MKNDYLITSEAVTEGHPDKLCDQISDGIVDALLKEDRYTHAAIEVMASKNCIMIAGEIDSNAKIDITETARKIIKDVGYISDKHGLDYKRCLILTNINKQSSDIAQGVRLDNDLTGAGDQGMMYGYACNETKVYMPLPYYLANQLAKRLTYLRKNNILAWIYPDGKTQVTIKYNALGEPVKITSIIVSTQHSEDISIERLRKEVLENVIAVELAEYAHLIDDSTKISINPTGRFVIGGPLGDTGLTGRKIIADSYGGIARHGGGAFSGKDPTKVDRSGAYMARYIAKNIVAAGLADKCEVSVAFAIGKSKPEAIRVDTFGTEKVSLHFIEKIVEEVFPFGVKDIIEILELREPQFLQTSVYGHFGKEDYNFAWERLDKVNLIKLKAMQYILENKG